MDKISKLDYKVIYDIVKEGASVLDLGCGDGELLSHLVKGKNIKAQGVELDDESIYKCVEKGLSVFHSDIDSGLRGYPDKSVDYVILNQSMQETKNADFVIKEALRVGHKVIVGFPNFAFFNSRFQIFFGGRTPVTPSLPYRWYNTPNLHFLSLTDFIRYCSENKITILERYYLGRRKLLKLFPNLFALNAIFLLTKPPL